MAKKLKDTTQEQFPFITVINYGDHEYVGVIINQDQHVTTFYDINAIHSNDEKNQFLTMGETWWWESNRLIPISIFLKNEIDRFKYCIKTFSSKGVRIVLGPTVNLLNLTHKRPKRRSVELIRRVD
jgi:hypothetical protein